MKKNRTYRIRTGVNDGTPVIHFNVDSSVSMYEILSLKVTQANAYRLMSFDKGVIAGRVLANNGFGVPNARVSVFVQYEDTDSLEKSLLYHYTSVRSVDDNGVRYNLLPSESDDNCHQTVGTFPNKRIMLDDDNWIDVFDKYYRYTTRTNSSGDYMIYGVPVGQQTVHMDVDLSDIGPLSQKPRDMMVEGYNAGMFENPNKFKGGTNLNSLVQIKSQDSSIYVYPFWGDTTETVSNAAITRLDIPINYTFKPTCVFMGSVISDTGDNSMSKKCVGAKNQGKMSEMMTGEGKIEMIRKTFDGNVEEFSVQGNQLINGDGVWCYQIPMNLDYIMTDEYGNTVLSDNPEKGIPTRARVRFRISMSESPNDGTARKRARYLVPNNPHLMEDDYPSFYKDKKPDYEFGTDTKDENFRDLMWNNVYTVKNYIPRIQKSNLPNNRRHLGIKTVNHPNGHNPMPFNNLRIRMNFTYRFMCILIKILVTITYGINKIATLLSYALFKIAQGFIAITTTLSFINSFGSFLGKKPNCGGEYKFWTIKKYKKCASNIGSVWFLATNDNTGHSTSNPDDMDSSDDGEPYNSNALSSASAPYIGALLMLGIIKKLDESITNTDTNRFIQLLRLIGNTQGTQLGGTRIGVKGIPAFLLAVVYEIKCGITLNSICESEDGEEISVTPGTIKKITTIFEQVGIIDPRMAFDTCNDDVSELYNCVENELAQDNEVTSFNFYNDWINGVLYFPLWYRKIKPKRRFLGIKIKAKDQWCSADTSWIRASADRRQLKVYDTCSMKMAFDTPQTDMREAIKPVPDDSYMTVDVNRSIADSQTGIEIVEFLGYTEYNCYGYQCHKYSRSYMPMRSGLMQERETMLGDLVYYYKPCEYNTRYTSDLITLFATDIVLLGSLSDCDIHGVPQFFKALESTTYNMPPDLMSDVYEYRKSDIPNSTDENDSSMIDESTRETEYTGADWGNLGVDQSNYHRYVNVGNTTIELDANENIYDNGGLFYGLTCFNGFTKPKSCFNLSRICEFGVSLDESQEILSTTDVAASPNNLTEDMYKTLTPDGFVSYDEIYNPDYRSMFATLNANFLRTKLNYSTGLTEYDFNHLYVDNFDGAMSILMSSPSVNGNTKKSNFGQRANYIGNKNLEKSSDAYLNFRYGNYRKANGKKLYYYDHSMQIGKVGPTGNKHEITSEDRLPRYENSFYFYFGLNEGKTAIDSFYSSYYSDCANETEMAQKYDITAYANSVCPIGTNDGCIIFSFNSQPTISIRISNADNDLESYHIEDMPVQQFYIGTVPSGVSLPGYRRAKLYEDAGGTEIQFLANGTYNLTIDTGDNEEFTYTVSVMPEPIVADIDGYDFTVRNNELDETFQHLDQHGEYDWGPMFQDIAEYMDGNSRLIGGYIKVGQANLENYKVTVEPATPSFFSDDNGNLLYTAPQSTVIGTSVSGSGDGYLWNDGTDIYFGVPYGNQRYIVTVTEVCFEHSQPGGAIPTSNSMTQSVTVSDGDFRMYVNGVDYDMLKSFRTGWSQDQLNPDTQEPSFNESDMYGWNDIDNAGKYYNPYTQSATPIVHVSDTDPIERIVAIGDVLYYDYDGNGRPFDVNGCDCSTPYSWNDEYCIPSDEWDAYKNILTSPNTIVYTTYNSETEEETSELVTNVVMNRIITIEHGNTIQYTCQIGTSIGVLGCTEYSDIGLVYEDGFSDLSGPTMAIMESVYNAINSVIDARTEFTDRVKGAFSTGYSGTELNVTYRSTATPMKYLIAGGNETSLVSELNSINRTVVINHDNPRIVFDPTDMETHTIGFTLPTITCTYDQTLQRYVYEPYATSVTIGTTVTDDKKIPYYIAIQNAVGVSIPTASSSSTGMADNFGANRYNPITQAMFGAHFFNNPIYCKYLRLVSALRWMPKYSSQTGEAVDTDALVIACAVNGIPSVSAKLDYAEDSLRISTEQAQYQYGASNNRRLLYHGTDGGYGKYQLSPQFLDQDSNQIEYQYFTLSRNRVLTIDDGYSQPYENDLVYSYAYNASEMNLSNPTVPEIQIPLSFDRTLSDASTYYVFRYNGSNHITDYAVYDTAELRWRITGDNQPDELNSMLAPGYDFSSHPGLIAEISAGNYGRIPSSYPYIPDDTLGSNPIFIVVEDPSTSALIFTPVIEPTHMISVHSFNTDPTLGQDGYTIYLMRRPINGNRTNRDVTDFRYMSTMPFSMEFRSGNEDDTFNSIVTYNVDPTDTSYCSFVDITVTDTPPTAPQDPPVVTSGHALKIQVDRIPGFVQEDMPNGIPVWYSIWTTDAVGVVRCCVATVTNDAGVVTVAES